MNVIEILRQRGFLEQMTHEDELVKLLDKPGVRFYNGYDPTADSLHIGHLLNFMAVSWMQKCGHIPIILLGGGTGMIGDPDKPDDMRPLLDIAEIDYNISRFAEQAARFIDFADGRAILINNGDWLRHLNYADFIRTYGVHFSVNRMLSADKYKTKFEGSGLNFFELNYMVMQAYDFLELSRSQNCFLQTGGSDQWSNIIAGVELIRRADKKQAYGMTFSLLARPDGQKMGKSLGGAIWLDAQKTSPYDFFQHFRNIPDSAVHEHLARLTFLPMEQVEELSAASGAALNASKEILAFEVTKIVHGEDEAQKALIAAKTVFAGGSQGAPETQMPPARFENPMPFLDLMKEIDLIPSLSEGRRLITQGGVSVNGEKITDTNHAVALADFADGEIMIKKGKKVFHKIVLKG